MSIDQSVVAIQNTTLYWKVCTEG